MHDQLALFPLQTVLFPGGTLHLRIFEPRYLDLVAECSRHDTGFGVCLILEGEEVGAPATPAAIGCEARIADFGSTEEGLLGLMVTGTRRFHITGTQVQESGLLVATVDWLDAPRPEPEPLPPEHGLLATLLARLHERFDSAPAGASQAHYDEANWVAWRLAELLPLTLTQRQLLLEDADGAARLQRLVTLIPELSKL